MKNSLRLLVIIAALLIACTNNKNIQTEDAKGNELEGLWTLKSGKWSNDDGTFLRFPEDSILHGSAFVMYGKNHFMLVAEAPRMDYFRGELVKYSVDGNKLNTTRIVSNIEELKGKTDVWTFKIEGNILTGKIGGDVEVWEKVE